VTLELDRRLVAVMFTDMVGYTALIQADERLVTLAEALALTTL
jgi:class 3 adenylate cyclase